MYPCCLVLSINEPSALSVGPTAWAIHVGPSRHASHVIVAISSQSHSPREARVALFWKMLGCHRVRNTLLVLRSESNGSDYVFINPQTKKPYTNLKKALGLLVG